MQHICHLSRRWHQQFCRSPSFLGHQRCLQQWQFRCYRQPPRPKRERAPADDDLVVREYEQIIGKPSTRRRMPNEFELEEKQARREIKLLERESAILRQGPFSSDFMQDLPADEREELLKSMEEEGTFNIDDIIGDDDLDVDDILEAQKKPKPLAVTLRIPAKHKAYVRRFNTALAESQSKDGESEKKALWVWYLRCQQKVTGFSNFVSEDVWDYLWRTQVEINPRTRHIVVLAKDMDAAGVTLDSQHLIDYLEALHATGETTTALKIWEERKPPTSDQIGVQLYAAVGRPSKAQEIAVTALSQNRNVDVTPVFKAWADSQRPNAAARLWTFYLQLKQRTDLSVDVLGKITSVLLEAGRQEMALAVFKDMIASRQSIPAESMQIYQKLMGGEPTEESINRIGLTALLALPQSFNNKFFFGAWIKWLLGENKVNDAALVVELMQEKGVRPDARHLNGIIGAWLREGSATARAKAEQMAWGMINARIRQVQRRGRTLLNSETEVINAQFHDKKRLPRFLQRDIPPATIETFSILLQRYTRQADLKKATQLTEIMTGPAQIKPNSFILNHWLYLSLRASDVDAMWARFKSVQDEIQPDLETFAALWDGERRCLNLPKRSATYPTPRQLYKEMIQWLNSLSTHRKAEVRAQFTQELYEQIVRCFCLHSDLPCTLLVLRHMHETFGLLPHEEIAGMIVMQIARMLPAEGVIASRPRRAARRRSDEIYRAALSNFANLMDEIHQQNINEAADREEGVELFDESDSEAVRAVRLESIQTFVCLIMLKQAKQGSHVDNDLVVAGRALGIEVDREKVRQNLDEAVRMYEADGAHEATG